MRNRFKGLDLIDRVLDELWTELRDIVQKTGIKPIYLSNFDLSGCLKLIMTCRDRHRDIGFAKSDCPKPLGLNKFNTNGPSRTPVPTNSNYSLNTPINPNLSTKIINKTI